MSVTIITSIKDTLKTHCFCSSRMSPLTSGETARPSFCNEDGRAGGGRGRDWGVGGGGRHETVDNIFEEQEVT